MNFTIRLPTRINILNAVVRSRLTYSCQAWNITARQRNRINSSYTGMLRKMVKGGYPRKSETEWNFQLTTIYTTFAKRKILVLLCYANKRNISHTWQDNPTGH